MFNFGKKNKKNSEIITNIYEKYKIKRYVYLFIGLILLSVSFNLFLLPNDIVFGGVSGISIITKKLFGIAPSIFIMISSIILLIVSYFVLGKEKTRGSVLGSILFPIFVKLTDNISQYLTFNDSEMLIYALFGGILYGIGAGLIFKAGFTTGGTDIINQIISKYLKVSMGNALIMSDGLIVLCGVFVFGITKLMYALVTLYIISILTDKVLLGISDSKAFYIIAEKDEEIKKYVLEQLGHGVTVFDAKGGFTKEKQKVLFCVIPTKDYFKLKEGIHEIDKDAFFVATDAYEVLGGE
ncbi:MAG: YitT family protein [Bacilli bacterium]